MSIQSPDLRHEQICQLFQHLVQTNPHFALWEIYKRGVSEHSVACEWRQFLSEQLGPGSEEEIEFACAMMELDKLLAVYHDQIWRFLASLTSASCFFISCADRSV